ncbi:MAG: asparaginase [Clostridia bacterium]|jgi:L-asparaginase|nr:asparaginase [Clostridia bacterium]
MKKILMIATGGTIASKNNGEGFTPALTSQELLACVPEIAEFCRVTTVQPFNLDSTNLCPAHWLELERIIEENYAAYDGFVLTHGTDTMAYTAAALSYLVQHSPKPIVLTGSQKSAYLRDSDARRNLADAFAFCADDNAFGVHIVFDGNVILGTRAKKTRTRSFNAFSSVDYPNTAIMRDGKPFYYVRGQEKQEPTFYRALNDSVFVLKMIPGMRADIFDWLEKNCQGLIVESFGTGGLPDYGDSALLHGLERFLAAGKTVVFTTQVEREGSSLTTYEVGRKLLKCGRVLEAHCMTLESIAAKLMWLLAFAKGEDIEKLFYTPVGTDIF